MKRLFFSIVIALCTVTVHAQKFLDSLRKSEPGQGSVTVTQSQEIDELVNGTEKKPDNITVLEQPSTPQQHGNTTSQHGNATVQHSSTAAQQHGNAASSHEHEKREPAHNATGQHDTATSSSTTTTTEEPVIDMRKKVMRNSYKTQGYRIQVFSGGNSRADRQKAETAGAVMKSNFPSEPIYVHFYSPSWKCRMGNYKSLEDARRHLAQVKKLGYKQACIVKGTISVQY